MCPGDREEGALEEKLSLLEHRAGLWSNDIPPWEPRTGSWATSVGPGWPTGSCEIQAILWNPKSHEVNTVLKKFKKIWM